jgi:molybdate transport system substrate-binding protein
MVVPPRHRNRVCLAVLAASCLACAASPDQQTRPVRVAVAGNFAPPLAELGRRFTERSGVPIEPSIGATGQLYAQIENGAPFDVFLAADDFRPALLERSGRAVPGSRFTYAIGRLVLLVPGHDSVAEPVIELRAGSIRTLAIANPRTAPYGAAAEAVLRRWGLWDSLESAIVRGENIAQAFQFVASGAADAGLVALAQVMHREPGEYRVLPDSLYAPIRQEAVLLQHGADHAGARAFLEFLRREDARRVIAAFGYYTP